jgi:alkylhydroperoxidase family enzyme
MYGLSDDEITAIREGKFDAFPAPEGSLLRMTDAMADTPSNVSDELYAELLRYFSEEQLIEFAAAAAHENYRARYNRVFDIGSDGLYRKGLRFKQKSEAA